MMAKVLPTYKNLLAVSQRVYYRNIVADSLDCEEMRGKKKQTQILRSS